MFFKTLLGTSPVTAHRESFFVSASFSFTADNLPDYPPMCALTHIGDGVGGERKKKAWLISQSDNHTTSLRDQMLCLLLACVASG